MPKRAANRLSLFPVRTHPSALEKTMCGGMLEARGLERCSIDMGMALRWYV